MERLNLIAGHLKPGYTSNGQMDDDIVICAFARTALCRGKRGSFKDSSIETMVAPVFKALLDRSGVDPAKIDDICMGNVLLPGCANAQCRMAQFLAGIPETTCLRTTNRQCSSGLEAVSQIAGQIKAGYIKVGIAGGVESMSTADMNGVVDPEKISEAVFEHPKARNCLMPMGITSENVAEKFNITREQQDQMAVDSHAKAAVAQKNGYFKDEIVPVTTTILDKEGNEKKVTADRDEGIREGTTLQKLGKLKAAFKKGGSTTAGNASQVTDGAAAVLVASRKVAKELGLPILAKLKSYAVKGVPPEIMGIGPAAAIPAALDQVGMSVGDIDIYELNEAFASQATYCVEKLGIPMSKVNPKGGAIAIGHPLGMTGARMICTLLTELKRTNKKHGVVSMCIGTGMGAAAIFENEQ